MKIISKLTLAGAAFALFATQAIQADEFSASTGKRPITIGIGALFKNKPYKDFKDGEKTNPVPIILYEGESFFVRGSNLGWKFVDSSGLELSLLGEYLADGYDSSDSHFLNGMDDRDPSFGIGGQAIWNPESLGFRLTAVTDVTDNSDGQQVVGELFYKLRLGDLMLKPSAGFVWQSDDYNDYYYGVKNKEARPGRPAYSADSDFNYRMGAVAIYQQKTSPWMFAGGLRYTYFGDEIQDSPIVGEDGEVMAFAGVAYTFR